MDDDEFDPKEYAIGVIGLQLRYGFYSLEHIHKLVLDQVRDDGGLDSGWVWRIIFQEHKILLEEQSEWPVVTDCDRLDDAFDELNLNGIIALHMAGFDQSMGQQDVDEIVEAEGGAKGGCMGYCFYHEQDLLSALENNGMYLAYGALGGEMDTTQIGQCIVRVLKKYKIRTEWSRQAEARIFMPDFEWQRRFNPDALLPGSGRF